MGFLGRLTSLAARVLGTKPGDQPDAAGPGGGGDLVFVYKPLGRENQPDGGGPAGGGDLVRLFEMSGEQEACAIVGALRQRGICPEEIVVVGFERVTVKVAQRDLESGRRALMEIRGEFLTVDWSKVEIAP